MGFFRASFDRSECFIYVWLKLCKLGPVGSIEGGCLLGIMLTFANLFAFLIGDFLGLKNL